MHEWLTVCRDIRAAMLTPAYLAWLAEVYGTLGRPAEGLALVDDALAAETDSGYRYWTAELHRLKGTLILQGGRKDASVEKRAESCFLEALQIARRQRAKLFELRAAMSLSRLWAKQGRREEGRALLAEVYGWFSEGFDTADLTEAKALLEELRQRTVGKEPNGRPQRHRLRRR
jgi:predicted ATPase